MHEILTSAFFKEETTGAALNACRHCILQLSTLIDQKMQNCVICENAFEKRGAGGDYKYRTDSKLGRLCVTVIDAFKDVSHRQVWT